MFLITLLIGSLSFGQSVINITTSGGSYATEKWVSITTAVDGGGTQVWGQGDGSYGNGQGLINQDITLAPGTYYVNCYDRYSDGWDGTLISVTAYGSTIGDNGGVSPSDAGTVDSNSSWETPADELEASFEIIVPVAPTCLVPSGLTIDAVGASTATISWTAGASETDWEIVVQADGTGAPGGSGTATSSNPYSALSLTSSTAYEVYLRADCGGGDYSDWIGPVDFTTDPSSAPSCPATFTSTPDACGDFDTVLSWDASATADGYRITAGTTMGGTDVRNNLDLGNVLTYTLDNQSPGTTYYYTISPYNVVGTTSCTEQTYTTAAAACLCASVPSSNDGNGISNVRIGIDDFASGDVTYFDHSGFVNQLNQGVPINVEITFETGYTYDTHIWIDFNDNGDLSDAGELVFSGESSS
ncbi:MAG: hypothetical protein ACPGRW_09370, partial [Flavobacteriaceae bacterium]